MATWVTRAGEDYIIMSVIICILHHVTWEIKYHVTPFMSC